MKQVPFTIQADLDLGGRVLPYITQTAPDVQVKKGYVPESLNGNARVFPACEVDEGRFLLNIPNGLRFYVVDGEAIYYDHPDDVTNREVLLFLLGSAWGVLAYQRQLLPLHASGIIHAGKDIYAFTGQSGAGKSTLAAALSDRGHKFFSDDVLLVDPSAVDGQLVCYAGQKDLKLWSEALKITGAKKKGLVRDDEDFDKYYADPRVYSDISAGQLKELHVLTSKGERRGKDMFSIESIDGAKSLKLLLHSVYRKGLAEHIVGRRRLFEWLARLIQHVDIYCFDRSFEKGAFREGVDFMCDHLPDPDLESEGSDPSS